MSPGPSFRLISCAWEKELLTARRGSPKSLQVICPFVKAPALERIVSAGLANTVQLITRFDLNCFTQGVSDISALRAVLRAGGKVRGIRGLHAKLYLFGDDSVVATSANVTDAAMRRNHEFGFAASDPPIVRTCREYFDRLWTGAGPDLAPAQLDKWDKILGKQRKRSSGTPATSLPDYGARVDSDSPFVPTGAVLSYPNHAFVKFSGTGYDRADRSLSVADVVAESGCNWACTYPSSKHPRQVRDGDVLYMGFLVYGPDDIMIFGKAIGSQHRDEEDVATKAEKALRRWKEDWGNYVRVHDGRFVDATLEQGVSFRDMMAAMGSDSFASTQRNAIGRAGNTDPTLSYLRKPGMLLTDQSRAWLDERLEAALHLHGEVDLSGRRYAPPGLPLETNGYPGH